MTEMELDARISDMIDNDMVEIAAHELVSKCPTFAIWLGMQTIGQKNGHNFDGKGGGTD